MKNVYGTSLRLGTLSLALLGSSATLVVGEGTFPSPPAKFITVDKTVDDAPPKGYVSITFDDAALSQYEHGLRIAKEFGLPGTLFVGTEGVEESTNNTVGFEWAMRWNHVEEFIEAGWEIGSHTHTHPNMTELTLDEVEAELAEAKRLIEERTGVTPVSYASPFGRYNEAVVAMATKFHPYHLMAWGGNEGRNPTSNIDPSYIGRMDVAVTTTPETVCGEMLQAAVQGTWTVFIFHRIVEGEPQEYEVSVDNFTEMMHCAAQLQEHGMIDVVTVDQAMGLMQSLNN